MLKSAASSLRRRRPKTTITATLAIEMPSQPQLASLLAVLVLLCYCDSCFFCYAGKFSSSLCFLFFCVPFSFGSSFFFYENKYKTNSRGNFQTRKAAQKATRKTLALEIEFEFERSIGCTYATFWFAAPFCPLIKSRVGKLAFLHWIHNKQR